MICRYGSAAIRARSLTPANFNRIDEMMAAHLQEAAIVEAIFADEDRLHRRLHVVVDAAPAGPFEQRKGPVMGIEHHLLTPLNRTTSWLQSNW